MCDHGYVVRVGVLEIICEVFQFPECEVCDRVGSAVIM
jgi:hypothetical protein